MRFITAVPFATLVLGVAADRILLNREPTLVERDVPTITNILLAVGSGISALDTAVLAFTGDPSTIESNSAALEATINSGTIDAAGSGNLTLGDAITLEGPVEALQALGSALVNDLIAQKSAFEANGLCEDISSQVTGIQSASNSLIAAIVLLVPAIAQGIADALVAPFEAALSEGVAAFASNNCTDVVSSSTTTTSSSPSTTSSSSTSTSSSASSSTTSPSPASSSSVSLSYPTTTSSSTIISSNSTTPPYVTASSTPSSNATTTCTSTSLTTTTCTTASGTGAGSKTTAATSSTLVAYTGAAVVNHATYSFGILALAAAVLLL